MSSLNRRTSLALGARVQRAQALRRGVDGRFESHTGARMRMVPPFRRANGENRGEQHGNPWAALTERTPQGVAYIHVRLSEAARRKAVHDWPPNPQAARASRRSSALLPRQKAQGTSSPIRVSRHSPVLESSIPSERLCSPVGDLLRETTSAPAAKTSHQRQENTLPVYPPFYPEMPRTSTLQHGRGVEGSGSPVGPPQGGSTCLVPRDNAADDRGSAASPADETAAVGRAGTTQAIPGLIVRCLSWRPRPCWGSGVGSVFAPAVGATPPRPRRRW